MLSNTEAFLKRYAQAFEQNDAALAASYCLLPTVIMSDESKIVFDKFDDLTCTFQRLIDILNNAGVVKLLPQISQTIRLSATLMFINMRWQFYDKNNDLCFTCAASYTLQKKDNDDLKIIVTVIDDNENALEKLFQKDHK